MSAFYVWNPHISKDSNLVECVVTNGDVTDGIARDRGFISALLQEVEVDEKPDHWTITCCRAKYYSDYLDSPDWPDIWQVVWKVSITTAGTIKRKRQKAPVMPWREADITGTDWIRSAPEKVACLAISDFKSQAALNKARQAILDDAEIKEMQLAYDRKEPVFGFAKALNKYPQLHILLGEFGDDFYAQGAPYAERVLQVCQQHGGTLNFSERKK